jgi:hypothetical protein
VVFKNNLARGVWGVGAPPPPPPPRCSACQRSAAPQQLTRLTHLQFGDNKMHAEILTKVYKELMILGVIAFMLIMGKEVGAVKWTPETLRTFEFCDLLVSICVLVYVGNCAFSSMAMHLTQRAWDRMALSPTSDVMESVKNHLDSLEGSVWNRIKQRVPMLATNWRAEADFKLLQMLFKIKYHLPDSFDYVQYINMRLQDVVILMCNISTWHWMMIMIINLVWWLLMRFVTPALGFEPLVDENICLVDCDDVVKTGRRRLGGSAGPSTCSAKLEDDMCEMTAVELAQAVTKLQTNATDNNYWAQCQACALSNERDDISREETLFWYRSARCNIVIISSPHRQQPSQCAAYSLLVVAGAWCIRALAGSLRSCSCSFSPSST